MDPLPTLEKWPVCHAPHHAGQETFTFTSNDLPPGTLAARLLAAGVRVVLTHAKPDTTSAVHPNAQSVLDSDMLRAGACEDFLRSTSPSTSGLAGAEGEVATPETEQDADSSEGATEGDDNQEEGDGTVEDNANISRPSSPTLTQPRSDHSLAADASKSADPLQITAVDDACSPEAPPWGRGLNTKLRSSLEGRSSPLLRAHLSPLRSCPRAAVARNEGLNNSCSSKSTEEKVRGQKGVPRWASSKKWMWGPEHHPLTPTPPAERTQHISSWVGRHSRTVTLPPPLEVSELNVPSPGKNANRGAGGNISTGDGSCGGGDNGRERAVPDGRKPWAVHIPEFPQADRNIKLDEVVLNTPRIRRRGCNGAFDLKEGDHLEEADITAEISPPTAPRIRNPPPAVKRLLETASKRSFDDLRSSSPHTSISDSDSDLDKSDGGSGGSCVDRGSFSDSDGEKASRAARALAGWVGSVSSRNSSRFIESEDLASIPPLKERGWPPLRPVVAGEMEVHDALMSGKEMPAGGPTRMWESVGSSWGEEAKRALAHKRLQWER